METANPEQYFLPSDPTNLLKADPARRTAVSFRSGALNLAGHIYPPQDTDPSDRLPGVVMCGPFSSVKEQTLPHYAERLADAGYAVLTFDPSNLGASEGEPRSHYDPNVVIADFSSGVTYLSLRDDIDQERIGAVGVCMGGGYAVSLGARDKRLRAVVSIAGGYDIGGTFQLFMGVEGFAAYYRQVNDLAQRQHETGKVAYIPTTAKSLGEEPVVAMPNEEAFSYYDRHESRPRAQLVTGVDRGVARALFHLQRNRSCPARCAHSVDDSPWDDRCTASSRVRAGNLRGCIGAKGTRVDRDTQSHRALRSRPVR